MGVVAEFFKCRPVVIEKLDLVAS